MKIEHIGFESDPQAQPPATLHLSPGLNLVDARSPANSRQLADLVGHVLYGARVGIDRSAHDDHPGYIDVSSQYGTFRLERHRDRANRGTYTEPRLTVAPLDGATARPQTARDLLGGMQPEIAARLLVLGSTNDNQLQWLLSEELAGELCRIEDARPIAADSVARHPATGDLLAERDRLAHQIELQLSDKRRSSEALEASLADLDLEVESADRRHNDHRREFDQVMAQLAELETQLRYHELAEFVGRTSDEAYHSEQQPELAGLDDEIAKWRRALAELETRESQVRRHLTQLHPDDSSPLLPLADQRACVTIAQRLVADLDSEIARYARPGDSAACLCQHTHARMHPLVDTLGQQVDKLAHLIEQYEAALAIEQFRAELQHLSRSQAELRATIEHLLDRRQSRLRTSRVRGAVDHVEGLPNDWQTLHTDLQNRQSELSSLVSDDERRLRELIARRERLQRERADLMNDSALVALRQQLDEVTRRLDQTPTSATRVNYSAAPWRASDILAKLTDGRLREVRLTDGGRRASVTNRQGTVVGQVDLNDVDRRLLSISLQLASVAGASQWGLHLPLLVADPFAQLPAAESAILALVLHDFARSGHQVLIVTASQSVVERLKSTGQAVLSFSPDSHANITTTTRIETPAPRPAPTIALHEADTFALGLDDSIERFSVFGDETFGVFTAIGIRTVQDLLEADADDVSRRLDRTAISSAIVELWQSHVAMLAYVPNLTLSDVQLLTGARIDGVEELAESDADALYAAIREYLDSPRGVRHRALRTGLSRDRVANWISDARRQRSRWQKSRYASRWRTRNGQRRSTRRTVRSQRSSTTKRVRRKRSANRGEKATRPLRFRLSRTSAVVDAPSVGPKTAKRLAKIGIDTVDDLLNANADETAAALDVKHISAETIVAWQHQAQLMCRVPELLARDTQVLVGCGFTTPEGIASAEAADLLEFAKSYTATSEGTRVLRGSDPPDLARVTKWIFWAGHRRAMEAA